MGSVDKVKDELKVTRREFLKAVSAGVALTVLASVAKSVEKGKAVLSFFNAARERRIAQNVVSYWGSMISYDRIARSTCAGNCTQACGWLAYIRGKTIIGLQQAADYDAYDKVMGKYYNPRGCARGASFVRYIYGPMRILFPYKRVGPRGSGKFKRITWEQALQEIASKIIDIVVDEARKTGGKDAGEVIVFFSPIPAFSYVSAGAGYRLANLLGASGPLSFYDWYCDLPPGEPMTWGTQTEESEEADWLNAKLIIVWGANVAESRIAAAHFLAEAKYRGTKIVYIGTDYNATARLADEFISVRPGTDAALALAMVKYIIDNKLYDEEYVKMYTDLPILVREDNRRFLRESDLKEGGSPFKVYMWDAKTNRPVVAPGCMADDRDLDYRKYGIEPVLDGEWEVTLKDGRRVKVKTVFRLLKEKLADLTLEKAEKITGVPAEKIKKLAEEIAKTKPTMIIEGGGTNHWYNNDLNNRSMILLLALTGNIGYPGSGFNQYTGQYKVWLKGLGKYGRILKTRPQNTTLFVWVHYYTELWRLGKTLDEIVRDIEAGRLKKLPGPLPGKFEEPVSADPRDVRGYRNYLILKALAKGWVPLYPKPPRRPRAMIIWRGNFLNQAKGGFKVLEWFSDPKKLELVVVIDFRMCTTALFADYVLPAATWYEKFDIETTPMHVYIQALNEVVPPLGEAKPDFYVFKELAKAISKEARRRGGVRFYDTKYKIVRDYSKIYEEFIDAACRENPYFKDKCVEGCLETPEMAAHFILKNSPVMYPDPKGYEKYKHQLAPEVRKLIEEKLFKGDVDGYIAGLLELIKQHPLPFPAAQTRPRPNVAWRDNVEQKIPWPAGGKMHYETEILPGGVKVPKLFISRYLGVIPKGGKTLTGRQQFYIDHSYFLALGEELPTYKEPEVDPLPDGRPAPLKLNTPHERWGTHSTFRDMDLLLRLQRYMAVISINPEDAAKRGIKDGDLVRAYNIYGEVVAIARVSPTVKPGEVWIANGAEMTTFIKGWFNGVTPIRPKPTQAIVYPEEPNPPFYHLKYGWNLWGVTGNECDTSVEVEKYKG
ncbi:MAG TPA: twin-arginine translocation signal domain-containing protein [Pyrodictium sp.]|nr:twin-arginine translocation signal domain-containing protein [Pyrodictium sp.]